MIKRRRLIGEPLEDGRLVNESVKSAAEAPAVQNPATPNSDLPNSTQPPASTNNYGAETYGTNGGERLHPVHDPSYDHDPNRKRVAIFGGTFDPIHIGHLILAEEAHFQLNLDQVFLVPAGDPPHKQDRRLTSNAHRIAMCEMATADIEYISISRIDADRPGPHYTADMIRLMQEEVGPDTQLFFLMGMDSLRDLPTWREAAWLVENCKLVALSRHDVTLDWAKLEAELPGVRERVIILDMPELEIASHKIQARVKMGHPIRHQVPRLVEGYIHKHKLYLQNGS